MAVTISYIFLSSPPLSSFRTVTYQNHTTWSHRSLYRYTGSFTCNASSKANDSNYSAAEESRWLREEQRWLREEQRWLREEARWNNERKSLLLQIQVLQSELDRFRARNDSVNFDVDFVVGDDSSASKTLVKMANLLKSLGNYSNIGVSGDSKSIADFSNKEIENNDKEKKKNEKTSVSSSLRKGAEGDEVRILQVKSEVDAPVNFDPVATPLSPPVSQNNDNDKKEKTRVNSSLRMGAEGDEVRILQEALMSLGFYSGEEDMEYSSFSDGTARAVKTWQASIGIREDGIMTAELLERLYASQEGQCCESSIEAAIQKIDQANGAVTEDREVQETVEKKGLTEDIYASQHRVFLLGENRWEEPSRLNKTKGNTQVSAGKCLTCKGEGRLLCMECDGTGEPNVEEQFLDWVEEEAKCPYCEGLGYNVCDVCHGNLVL